MMDLNEQLGRFVGHYIYFNFLPTLNVDLIQSHNVIEVSEEDYVEYLLISKALRNKYKFNGGDGNTDIEYENYKTFQHHLAKKYLPNILVCDIPKIYVTDIDLFKTGLRDQLWNTDLCWYKIDAIDDIDISHTNVSTIIKLKLDVEI